MALKQRQGSPCAPEEIKNIPKPRSRLAATDLRRDDESIRTRSSIDTNVMSPSLSLSLSQKDTSQEYPLADSASGIATRRNTRRLAVSRLLGLSLRSAKDPVYILWSTLLISIFVYDIVFLFFFLLPRSCALL